MPRGGWREGGALQCGVADSQGVGSEAERADLCVN